MLRGQKIFFNNIRYTKLPDENNNKISDKDVSTVTFVMKKNIYISSILLKHTCMVMSYDQGVGKFKSLYILKFICIICIT